MAPGIDGREAFLRLLGRWPMPACALLQLPGDSVHPPCNSTRNPLKGVFAARRRGILKPCTGTIDGNLENQ
ncbi:MAG: hypothetical protein QNJ22_24405 [Desulfosarcinaceae bacterium]|nr:hypothetical protein [Desulfosarcinaceae bacterium]